MQTEKCHCSKAEDRMYVELNYGPKKPRFINGQHFRLSLIQERCECRNQSARLKSRPGASDTHMDVLEPYPLPITDNGKMQVPSNHVTPGELKNLEWKPPTLLENKSSPSTTYSGPGSWSHKDTRGSFHYSPTHENVTLKDSLGNEIAQIQLDPITVLPVENKGEVDQEGFETVFPIGFEMIKYN